MNRIKISIALITVFGLMLSTVGVAGAKTATSSNHAKVSHSINLTQHQVKHQTTNSKAVRKTTIKTARAQTKHTAKKTAIKSAKAQTKHTVKKAASKTAKAHTNPVIKHI